MSLPDPGAGARAAACGQAEASRLGRGCDEEERWSGRSGGCRRLLLKPSEPGWPDPPSPLSGEGCGHYGNRRSRIRRSCRCGAGAPLLPSSKRPGNDPGPNRGDLPPMSTLTELTPAQRTAREVWTSGDYPEVADRLIRGFGPALVEELKIHGGQQVLDIACGAGNVAIPAAKAGADVTGVDITPSCSSAAPRTLPRRRRVGRLDRGRRRGAAVPRRELRRRDERGRHHVLPESRAGCRGARPLCRPGGSIGLVAWTPEGLIGSMLGVLRAVRAAAPGRHPAGPALGHRGARARTDRNRRHRPAQRAPQRSSSTASRPTRSSTSCA